MTDTDSRDHYRNAVRKAGYPARIIVPADAVVYTRALRVFGTVHVVQLAPNGTATMTQCKSRVIGGELITGHHAVSMVMQPCRTCFAGWPTKRPARAAANARR